MRRITLLNLAGQLRIKVRIIGNKKYNNKIINFTNIYYGTATSYTSVKKEFKILLDRAIGHVIFQYVNDGGILDINLRNRIYKVRSIDEMNKMFNVQTGMFESPALSQFVGLNKVSVDLQILSYDVLYLNEVVKIKRYNIKGKYYVIARDTKTGQILTRGKWTQRKDIDNIYYDEFKNFDDFGY